MLLLTENCLHRYIVTSLSIVDCTFITQYIIIVFRAPNPTDIELERNVGFLQPPLGGAQYITAYSIIIALNVVQWIYNNPFSILRWYLESEIGWSCYTSPRQWISEPTIVSRLVAQGLPEQLVMPWLQYKDGTNTKSLYVPNYQFYIYGVLGDPFAVPWGSLENSVRNTIMY